MRSTATRSRMLGMALIGAALVLLLGGMTARAEYDPTEEIARIQEKIDAEGLGWTAGVTSMNLLPPEERRLRLGYEIPPGETGILSEESKIVTPTRDLPAVWDWRVEGGVTPVKNQLACGSCWDFAGTAAFESVIRIYSDRLEDLSEQQVLVCNVAGQGCSGGWMSTAYDHFMYPGAIDESCMPYTGRDWTECTEAECPMVDVLDYYADIIPNTVATLKEKIYDHPVAVAFTVLDDFHSYSGGCYDTPGGGAVNHAMLLVGWDDTACDDNGAWIVKNSWGLGWGIGGYAYIQYGCCSIGYGAQEIFYTGIGVVHISHETLQDTEDTENPYEVGIYIVSQEDPIDDSSVYLHYNLGAGWVDVLMDPDRDGEEGSYHASIPPQPLGTTIDYWLSAADTGDDSDVDPMDAPETCHSFRVILTYFSDDAESAQEGWEFGADDDDATAGFWERGTPEGTWGLGDRPGNPDRDHTPDPGYRCFCTGCEAGAQHHSNDVDNGKTTLISPVCRLGGLTTTELTYYRWYTNNAGQYADEDYWQVDVTDDNGETWVNLEYTNETQAYWMERTFNLEEYVTLTDEVRLRFVASDLYNPSTVEGGVDDVGLVGIEFPAGVNGPAVVRRIQLTQGPNPFVSGHATMRFELPQATDGTLRVYGVDGRTVRTLLNGRLQSGVTNLVWDGLDEGGREVPAGVYLIRLATPSEQAEGRLLRLR